MQSENYARDRQTNSKEVERLNHKLERNKIPTDKKVLIVLWPTRIQTKMVVNHLIPGIPFSGL